jgi:tRNA G18 (ribose-2'-O)-methylase SpoU
MLTRCPNPRCKHMFEVPDDRQGKNGPCPACGQVITYRSLAVLEEIERQHRRTVEHCRTSRQGHTGLAKVRFGAVLEDIRSLWNVGAIFRTADGAGFAPLYLCGITGCPPHKAIAKTSLGAEETVPWEHCASTLEILPQLRAAGIRLVALEKTDQSVPLQEAVAAGAVKPPLCLIVGNEVAGLSAETLGAADMHCHLPMRGVKGSLNVAVAFGVAAYVVTGTTVG